MITVKREDYEAILAHARACLPEEACGLIGGTIDPAGNKRVEKVYLLENTDHSNEHFTLSPPGPAGGGEGHAGQRLDALGQLAQPPGVPLPPQPGG